MATARLRILETTDLHMHLLQFDYLTETATADRGLAALAPLITAARAAAPATLLFDNGDFLQGTPLADLLAEEGLQDAPHPMLTAFTRLRYDAITLGNHEFDYGLPFLRAALKGFGPPIVTSNIRTGPRSYLCAPWQVLTRDLPCSDGITRQIRIGVLGFAPPQVVEWNAHHLSGQIVADDILAAARTHLPTLRREKADVVIALCHAGITDAPWQAGMENAALPLAALHGIDVVLAGHTHAHFPHADFDGMSGVDAVRGTLNGRPAVMAGANGDALGQIDLTLAHGPDGWRIEDHAARVLHPPAEQGDTPQAMTGIVVDAPVAEMQKRTLERLRRPVTETPRALDSYFAVLGRDETTDLAARAMSAAVRRGLADSDLSELPILAATASFRAGGRAGLRNYIDLPAGPVMLRDVKAMLPFNNPVCGVLRRGWEIRDWLERASRFFRVVAPGTQDTPLVDSHVAHYHFDTFHGLRYRIDLAVPPRDNSVAGTGPRRVRDVTFEGERLEDDALFIVATSSYRARGGGGQVQIPAADIVYTSDRGVSELLAADLADHGVPDLADPVPWSFVPLPRTRVVFATSPAVKPTRAERTGLALQDLGPAPDGFRRYGLDL